MEHHQGRKLTSIRNCQTVLLKLQPNGSTCEASSRMSNRREAQVGRLTVAPHDRIERVLVERGGVEV